MLKFEDVRNCVDVANLNWFIETYLDERGLKGEARRRTFWALFYAWKDKVSCGSGKRMERRRSDMSKADKSLE